MLDPFDLFTNDRDSTYRSAADAAPRTRSKDTASEHALRNLDERIEKLTLINMALWSLVQDKLHLTEKDLLERVRMIDLMDGKEDGKATRTVAKCPQCNRTMSPRHNRCLYCGHERLIQSAFDAL